MLRDIMEELMRLALQADPAHLRRVLDLLGKSDGRAVPEFWAPGISQELHVPVPGAELRVYHYRPARTAVRRPIVLLPGWGTIPQGFQGFFEALHGQAELYYLETREKNSSRLLERRPDLSVLRSARDIQAALQALGLAGKKDFVLVGACWGSAQILEGLLAGELDAPTILLADPMHALWFPKWVLRWISPLLPSALVRLLRPLLRQAMLGDMKESVSKKRTFAFVNSADIWKWKKSAEAARDFELFGRLAAVKRELFVLNGTFDKVHDQSHYPRIARELPGGRFLYLPVDETHRERMFAAVALEFARQSAADGLPASLAGFEKKVR
jgi:pimeloyl-ACP methyl ester carboxylesterase